MNKNITNSQETNVNLLSDTEIPDTRFGKITRFFQKIKQSD